jgi:branched-subunit amino acid transport protein
MILESAAIVAIGSLLGYVGSHALVAVIAPMLLESAGVVIQPWQHDSSSVSVILALMSAGVLIGTVPGIKAYRNDPVRNLASL